MTQLEHVIQRVGVQPRQADLVHDGEHNGAIHTDSLPKVQGNRAARWTLRTVLALVRLGPVPHILERYRQRFGFGRRNHGVDMRVKDEGIIGDRRIIIINVVTIVRTIVIFNVSGRSRRGGTGSRATWDEQHKHACQQTSDVDSNA